VDVSNVKTFSMSLKTKKIVNTAIVDHEKSAKKTVHAKNVMILKSLEQQERMLENV